MAERNVVEKKLTLPEVKKIMEAMGEENLDQFQRRTFDYVSKFSKIQPEKAQELTNKLVTEFSLDEVDAIQIVNCAPSSIEELRSFVAGGRKILEASKLEAMIALINESRKPK